MSWDHRKTAAAAEQVRLCSLLVPVPEHVTRATPKPSCFRCGYPADTTARVCSRQDCPFRPVRSAPHKPSAADVERWATGTA